MRILIRMKIFSFKNCLRCRAKRFTLITFLLIFILYSINHFTNLVNEQNLSLHLTKQSLCNHNKLFSLFLSSKELWYNLLNQLNSITNEDYSVISWSSNQFIHFIPLSHSIKVIITKPTYYIDLKLKYAIKNTGTVLDQFNEYYLMNNVNYILHQYKNQKSKIKTYREHKPTYFNVTKSLKAISNGLSDLEVPINNEHLIILQLPTRVCNPCGRKKKLDLIVIVKSCVYCFGQRLYARQTYMKKNLWHDFDVEFVFSVGIPVPNETNIYHFNGINIQLTLNTWQLSNRYGISRWTAAKALNNESKQYNDMLIGAYYDTYFNLTTKMMFSFRWAKQFCLDQSPLFLFLDDDFLLYPKNTIKLVKKLKTLKVKSVAAGSVYSGNVERPKGKFSHRWSLTKHEYPWDKYPPYFIGICYLLGADVVHDASVAMLFTQKLRIDDVYLGIILKRLNQSLTDLNNFPVHPYKKDLDSGAITITRYLGEKYVNWETGLIIDETN
ncbi:3-galactosyltransferase 5 [Schistosoma japonicum]|uniref:Hexosyltransferase n=1 Tax=Schistosoma japonicum TaxID=6182 RepID=A0A4Z2DPN1_SCHJA|nr:3-galactosyltransferase 5 [Schistosoma japonicum]